MVFAFKPFRDCERVEALGEVIVRLWSTARRFVPGVLVSAMLLSACSSHAPTRTNVDAIPPISVSVARLVRKTFASHVELGGNLAAVQSVTVGAISPGLVTNVSVHVGDRVAAGQILAQIDAAGYAAGLAQARAGASAAVANQQAGSASLAAAQSAIVGARAQLAAAQSRYQLAQTTAGRMASLLAQGAISKQQNDEAQANLAAARAATAQAAAGVTGSSEAYRAASAQSQAAGAMSAQARAGVAAADVPLENATVRAPFDGVVTDKFVQSGAVVGPGSPVVSIENTHDLELDVAVSNNDLLGLAVGQPVNVHVDASTALVDGRIQSIVPSGDPTLRSAMVKISVVSEPGFLPGMYARVALPGPSHSALAVPRSALVSRAGQTGVFELRAGEASFVPVQTGALDANSIEVRGEHLAGGEVITSNIERLTDGAPVTVQR